MTLISFNESFLPHIYFLFPPRFAIIWNLSKEITKRPKSRVCIDDIRKNSSPTAATKLLTDPNNKCYTGRFVAQLKVEITLSNTLYIKYLCDIDVEEKTTSGVNVSDGNKKPIPNDKQPFSNTIYPGKMI